MIGVKKLTVCILLGCCSAQLTAEASPMSEFEKWQKKEQSKYKNKRSKAQHKEDAGVEDMFSRYQSNRARASVDGLRSDNDKLKSSYNMEFNLDEELNIDEYVNTSALKTAHMTNAVKSAIKQFDKKFGVRKTSVISENTSSGDKNE